MTEIIVRPPDFQSTQLERVSETPELLDLVYRTRILASSITRGIDLRMARLIVWGVHQGQLDRLDIALSAKNLLMDRATLQLLAAIYRNIFRIDVCREEQPDCYLCGRRLPPLEETLCECYLSSVEGEYVTPDSVSIEALKELHPKNWMNRLQATHRCLTCNNTFNVSVGDVANQLNKGKDWVAPRWCRNCFKRPSSRPPAPGRKMMRLPETGES